MKNLAKKLVLPIMVAGATYGLFGQEKQQQKYDLLAPAVVDSVDYKNKLATHNLDAYYYANDLITRQIVADGKELTQANFNMYSQKMHQNALSGKPKLDNIVGIGVRNLSDGKKELTYYFQENRKKTVSVDGMRTDLNYTLAEINAAAQQIPIQLDNCFECDVYNQPQEARQQKTRNNNGFNYLDNLVVGYTHNFPAQSSDSDVDPNFGGNIHLGIPLSEKLNLELAYTIGAENFSEDMQRIVNESVQTNSGRIFEDVTYKGFSVEANNIGKAGLSYDMNPRGKVPVTLGLGVNIASLALNQYEDNKQEAFFDENNDGMIDLDTEFVGEGTLPENYITPTAKAEKLIGADAFIQFGLPQTGLRFRAGASYTPKADVSVDGNGDITRGNQTTLYAGAVFTFGNWGRK